MQASPAPLFDRPAWMGLLSRAAPQMLAERLALALPEGLADHSLLRGPEVGSVMVQGRMGGTGDAFHLGEMTVTRCSVRLATGEVGHAVVQGRSAEQARRAAVVDALLQNPLHAGLHSSLLAPLAEAEAAAARGRAEKAAATQVEFFTLMRGEDA